MEDIYRRFPSAALKIFKILDNQSLVRARKTNQSIKDFLGNERLFYLRIINSFEGNFVQFEYAWKKVVHKISVEMTKELALKVKEFFAYKSKRYEKQWHPLHIAAERGHMQLCINTRRS